MSATEQILLFFGLQWGGALAAWLWIRRQMKKDAASDQATKEQQP